MRLADPRRTEGALKDGEGGPLRLGEVGAGEVPPRLRQLLLGGEEGLHLALGLRGCADGGLGRRWRSGAAVAVWGGRGGGRGTAAQERPQGLARAVVARAAAAWLAATRTAVRPVATQAAVDRRLRQSVDCIRAVFECHLCAPKLRVAR